MRRLVRGCRNDSLRFIAMSHPLAPTATQLRLRRCDPASCEAACCYDGAYLLAGEEQLIGEVVARFPEDFPMLAGAEPVEDGFWNGKLHGRKTATRAFEPTADDWPGHFAHTRCVFAGPNHFCGLESLARRLELHPWTFKPAACWLAPLRVDRNGVVPPPADPARDPDRLGPEYPGYSCFVRCGRHDPSGEPWTEALAQEISYYDNCDGLPVWALKGMTLDEIIAASRATNESEKQV